MNKRKIIFPTIVVLVAIVIGAGILVSRKQFEPSEITSPILDTGKKINLRPISNNDHIYGNPNADIMIVTYSDLECPSCQKFHSTMKRILDEYAKSGTVAWVYRHFPIEKTHPNSMSASIASECVASISGEPAFWEYIDRLFEGATNSLLPENLKKISKEIGVDEAKFDSCMVLQNDNQIIKQSIADGRAIFETDSNFGTPYTIILSRSGLQTQLIGNHDLEEIIEIINLMK